ncbi:MAG: hypothetical protein KBD53_08745 [Candidatus Omnitrophica bacterium]|nr:hypothetical protein [Candidatus Omnitrophota bacterium]
MITDFLKYHEIPYPPHLDGWEEFEHVRVLKFQGPINKITLPGILEFRKKLDSAGLPQKNFIIDTKKVTDIDTSAIAVILMEIKKGNEKVGIIHPPAELKGYMEIFHQSGQLPVFNTKEEAIEALNVKPTVKGYFPKVTKTLKTYKSLSLLFSLFFFIVTLPFFEERSTAIIYLFLFTFVLLSGIYAVSYNIRHVAGGILLAAPTLITAWSNMFLQNKQILNAEMCFLAIFLVYTLSVILLHILSVKKVTVNELFGAICVYIMIGMTFGVIYALLESLVAGSLSFPPGEEPSANLTAYYYFSFVSMSSTGFSGFTAVSSLARAIVIVQVIIGVMYVSALIGKLVGANSPDEDGLFDRIEQKLKSDIWAQEVTESFFKNRSVLLVLSMAMLNYSGSVLMTFLNLPFFLDTWGTSLAIVLGGLKAGILAGIIYNLVMAFTFWDPSSWVWMFCNVFMALITWIFFKRGWINLHKPIRLISVGIISGVLNSIIVMIITWMTHLPTYKGTMVVYHFFVGLTGNTEFASIAEKMAVEVTDKSISLLLVAVSVIFIHDLLNWSKKSNSELVKIK